jgi:uncharacterized damage-inducible protein DinB
MTDFHIGRPAEDEHLPYYRRYIDLVPEGDLLDIMARQNDVSLDLLRGLSEDQGAYRYAPGKWSIKELVAHLSDAERLFADRALRFARADSTALPGFEEDDYVRNGTFDSFSLADLTAGFANVRRATLSLFTLMLPEATTRKGRANNAEITVRALAYVIAGHELHHMNVLRSRYLAASPPV